MSKLSPELQADVLARVRSGATYESIVGWLAEEKLVQVTKQAISKLVGKHRGAVVDANKIVAREHTGKRLSRDLDAFDAEDEKTAEAFQLALDAYLSEPSQVNAGNLAKIGALRLRMRELHLKVTGLDQPDEKATTLSALLARPPAE